MSGYDVAMDIRSWVLALLAGGVNLVLVSCAGGGGGAADAGDSWRGANYPVARSGARAGHVISPYPPYNIIDVTGMPSGSLVLDPSTNQRFLLP